MPLKNAEIEAVTLRTPQECSLTEKNDFCDLVIAGGEVKPAYVKDGVERAQALAFLADGRTIVGVGCLKNPKPGYKRGVFDKARSDLDPDLFVFEVGYVCVREDYQGRGYSKALTAALVKDIKVPIFATSAIGKTRMHSTLMRHGFRREGQAYESVEEPGKMLLLFVRN